MSHILLRLMVTGLMVERYNTSDSSGDHRFKIQIVKNGPSEKSKERHDRGEISKPNTATCRN